MLLSFLFSFALSFAGSLPPGPGNLAVLHTVLNKNTRAGLWVAVGASIPEIPYSFLAVIAVQYVSAFSSFNFTLEIVTAAVLLIIGVYSTFFQKSKEEVLDKEGKAEKYNLHPFWTGFIVALFNPMLVAFWLVSSKMAHNIGWLNPAKLSHQISFVLGTSAGAFVLLVLVALLTNKIRSRISTKSIATLNKSIGFMFLILAVVHIGKLCFKYFGNPLNGL